jgi:hypothetical protein
VSAANIPFKLTSAGIDAAFNLGAVSLNVTHVQIGAGNRTPNGGEVALVDPKEYAAISGHFEVSAGQHRIAAVIAGSGLAYNVAEIGLWSGVPGAGGSVLVFYWSQASGAIAVKSASVDFNFEDDMFFGGVVPGNITIVADTEFNALAMLVAHESQDDPHPGYLLESDIVSQADAQAGTSTVAKAWTAERVRKAANSAIQIGSSITANAGGTADAIVSSFTPAITELTDGMVLHVRAAEANETTNPTFTPNNGVVAADVIVKGNNLPLAKGDIAGSGHWLELKRDAMLEKWVLLNPAHGVAIFPAFSVNRNGVDQLSIANNVATKVAFNSEAFDTNDNFDSVTNHRFTPTVEGVYSLFFQCRFNNATDQSTAWASIYKNGAALVHDIMVQSGTTATQTSRAQTLVYMNGTTDYVEFYVLQDTGSARNLLGAINQTYATGFKIP